MTRSEPPCRAQRSPLDDAIESQGSQAIFDAHQALFGAAKVGSASGDAAAAWDAAGICGGEPEVSAGACRALAVNADRPGKQAVVDGPGRASSEPLADTLPLKGAPAGYAVLGPHGKDSSPPDRSMAVSQETPTQANEDRDYGACFAIPCSPMARAAVGQGFGHETPDAADTGAVSFGNLSDHARPSSQVSQDGGFDSTRSAWRTADVTSQLNPAPAQTPNAPETPALPKNPFAAKPSVAAPFAASQLFGQTQQLSSAARVSPTSSRPSPHAFLDSISPNVFEASPLKSRANVSSPTNVQTSSPTRLHETPGALANGNAPAAASGKRDRGLSKEGLVPESPTLQARPSSTARPPLAHYEPMKQSQARKTGVDGPSIRPSSGNGSDDDDDDGPLVQLERRNRAERKRALAAQEMERVGFAQHSRHDSFEKPTRKKRRLVHQETAATGPAQPSSAGGMQGVQTASDPGLPTLVEHDKDGAGQDMVEPPSQPPTLRRTQIRYGSRRRQRTNVASPLSTVSTVLPTVSSFEQHAGRGTAAQYLDTEMLDGSRVDSSELVQTRVRRSGRHAETPVQQPRAKDEDHLAPSSTLTTLSATPLSSSKTTPGTPASPIAPGRKTMASVVSPDNRRMLRKRPLRSVVEPESPQPSGGAELSRPWARQDSESPDELHHSPVGSTFSRSLVLPKCGRLFRQSVASTHRGRLLDGMAFALSFQSARSEQQRVRLEARIAQAGGTILKEGFRALFEPSANPGVSDDDGLRLARTSSHYGFVALIADGHSRKPKYMQALALGLPCLAPRWITKCLDKAELVDWEPFLLGAGSSAVLGEAVRSRSLAIYPAATGRAVDVLEHRKKLLQGQTVLVVADAKKSRSQARQQYMFLVQAMGPTRLSRATPNEARAVLRGRQKVAEPFDWLYVDSSAGTVDGLLAPPSTGSRRGKALAAPLRGYSRVLTDELVIQSLILGQMVEPEDADF